MICQAVPVGRACCWVCKVYLVLTMSDAQKDNESGVRFTKEVRIPVVEEKLSVWKQVHETGRVRVTQHVKEEEKMMQAALQHEEVDIQRVPVNRAVEAWPEVREEGDVTIIPVVEERLVVQKQLVVTEEIRLTRRRRTERVSQQHLLRRTEPIVEHLPADE